MDRDRLVTMADVEFTVDMHRTIKSDGQSLVEYACVVNGPFGCMSWHRYTDFAELHAQIAEELGLSPRFCCPKVPIFLESHKTGRAAELQAYMHNCLGRLDGQPMPVALHAFLYTPTTMSTSGRSCADLIASGLFSSRDLSTCLSPLEAVHEHDAQADVAGKVAEWPRAWVGGAVVASQEVSMTKPFAGAPGYLARFISHMPLGSMTGARATVCALLFIPYFAILFASLS